MLWRKFNGEAIELPIKSAVEKAIQKETKAGNRLKVCIGTDSQVRSKETEFATVIVFLREGRANHDRLARNGGQYGASCRVQYSSHLPTCRVRNDS